MTTTPTQTPTIPKIDRAHPLVHFAHRSGYERFQKCPRSYFWNQAYQGIGVERARVDVPLARGIYVHRGLEAILRGDRIDDAIKFALAKFDEAIWSSSRSKLPRTGIRGRTRRRCVMFRDCRNCARSSIGSGNGGRQSVRFLLSMLFLPYTVKGPVTGW